MIRFLVILVVIVVAFNRGFNYLLSDDFQAYADQSKAIWTCEVTYVLGQYNELLSRYQRAGFYFQKVIARCPDTPVCEQAEFAYATALQSMGRRRDAGNAFHAFAEKYPGSRRSRVARKAADLLR